MRDPADGRKPAQHAGHVEQFFLGTVTVGERGQVVIPAEARRKYNIETGDKLLVMGHPSKQGLMLCKIDTMREIMTQLLSDLEFVHAKVSEGGLELTDTEATETTK